MAKLFEYAVILDEKRDKDGEIVEDAQVIVPVETVLCKDERTANMIAARKIPDEFIEDGKVDRLQIVVRPF